MNGLFRELKVIELANVLAGPAAGMFFAELGAEVIKIENRLTGGDVTRSWKIASEDPASSASAYFASVNRNKKFLAFDLTVKEEQQQVYELLKTADIVICNYKPGDDLKLGMDDDTIRKINPSIIYASVTGFGEHVKRTAYDLVLQAETGFMSMNGEPGGGPLKMPVALIDILAAHQLKEGILLALIKRMQTGKGSKVSISLYDAAIASLANQAGNWLMAGEDPRALGSLHPNIAPYGEIFPTADDKQIVLAIGNNKQFGKLCTVLQLDSLLSDIRFNSNPERVKNRKLLFDALQPAFLKAEASVLMKQFLSEDIPAGMIRTLKEVFAEPEAARLVNTWQSDGKLLKNVSTAVFRIE